MSKKLRRILSLALVLCCLLSCIPSAFAERTYSVNRSKSSKVSIITCGDTIFRRTTKVTIQNTSKVDSFNSGTIIVNILSHNGCSYSGYHVIKIAPGTSKTFNIYTWRGSVGDTILKIEAADCGAISCAVKVNDKSMIVRQ